jgi:hypothetical protein
VKEFDDAFRHRAVIRPDWDLSAAGLREAWDAGDVSHFHGWDRRSPEAVAAERKRVAR